MSRQNFLRFFLVAGLGVGLTGGMGATTVTVTAGTTTSPMASVAGVSTVDFDSGSAPAQFTFAGNSGVIRGSRQDVYRQPGSDATNYAYVGPSGSITETLGAGGVGVNYFGFYWGSPDAYNSLTFTDTQGNQVVYGEGGLAIPTFTQYQGNSESYVEFNVTGNNWVSAKWMSATPAFEFDNVSYGIIGSSAVTPEPSSLVLLGLSLLAFGTGAVRRRISKN